MISFTDQYLSLFLKVGFPLKPIKLLHLPLDAVQTLEYTLKAFQGKVGI
jgi:hypothetical protein